MREGEEASCMRRATRRQGRAVRQSKEHDREGMRREERLQAGKVSELEEQSRAPRVCNEWRRGCESRQHHRARESSGQGVDRPRRRERKRNGDRQTLSVVRHFVNETQDGSEVKRCKWEGARGSG